MLRLRGVAAFYGRVQALFGVDLDVGPGELVALLGANGAGKSTVLRAISRLVRTSGELSVNEHDLTRLSTDAVARVPEGRGTFTELTVRENLTLAARARARRDRHLVVEDTQNVFEYFPSLKEFADRTAGSLSGGQQQMLAIARGVLARPQLLLVDEPSLGLAPMLAREILGRLGALRERWGLAILLAEQNAALALDVADRALILESGRVVASGRADELRRSDVVRASYLGM
jgi:branched-chain amino acid transport system ATP-binding protein